MNPEYKPEDHTVGTGRKSFRNMVTCSSELQEQS